MQSRILPKSVHNLRLVPLTTFRRQPLTLSKSHRMMSTASHSLKQSYQLWCRQAPRLEQYCKCVVLGTV